jgi:hypothetical protein
MILKYARSNFGERVRSQHGQGLGHPHRPGLVHPRPARLEARRFGLPRPAYM